MKYKYILTYQISPIDSEKLSAIYELNKNYRDNLNFKKDERIGNYQIFLPNPNQEHFVFVENDQILHLESEVTNLSEFQIEANSRKIIFNKAQANFRMAQNFAWATQLKTNNKQQMALVYLYAIPEDLYIKLSQQIKNYRKYDTTKEFERLQQKSRNKLRSAYKTKNIYLCPSLPEEAKLIGIFNPTTGVQNKSIMFGKKSTADISYEEKRFIDAVKYALVGYQPAQNNEFGLTSYDEFQMPIVNLSNNIMYLCNSDSADILEDAMLATSSSGDNVGKRAGYCSTIFQSLKSDNSKPSAPEYEEILDSLRSKKQEIAEMPIISALERQDLVRRFANMQKTIFNMQKRLDVQVKIGELQKQEIDDLKGKQDDLKRRQKILVESYCKKRLIICEKNYINDHRELRAFYWELINKLTEFFIACKVISSGMVERKNDKIQDGANLGKKVAVGICEFGEQVLGFIPGIGFAINAVGRIVEGGFEVGNAIYNEREVTLLKGISRLAGSLSKMDKMIEEAARHLALSYEKQIRCLTFASRQKGIKKLLAKGNFIDSHQNGGAENLAKAAAARIISAMRAGIIDFKKDEDLVTQMVKAVAFLVQESDKFTLFKKVRLDTNKPEILKKWNSNGVFHRAGVQLTEETKEAKYYYHGENKKSPCGRPEKYGYRSGYEGEKDGLGKLGIFKSHKPIGNDVDKLISDTDTYCPSTQEQIITPTYPM